MERRTFLTAAAGLAVSPLAAVMPSTVIDTHTHFYDPTRPQGVPWPPKDNKLLYRPVLPAEFRKMTAPLGVTGTIEVEASPWLEDNQWVLDLAAREPVIKGTVGNIEAGKPEFAKSLERFHRNPLFRGIRVGRLWGRDLAADSPHPSFISDIRLLAEADLELDVVGGPPVLPALLRLTDRIPNLRVVIDHLPFDPPSEGAARNEYKAALREAGKRPQVYAKVSNVLRNKDGGVPDDADSYRDVLDELWDIFGADRVIYGSNWPVSDRVGPYRSVLKVVREYFTAKGSDVAEKYFWKNSKAAYKWVERR